MSQVKSHPSLFPIVEWGIFGQTASQGSWSGMGSTEAGSVLAVPAP